MGRNGQISGSFHNKSENKSDADLAAKTVPETQGHFGSKTLCGISWNGAGALAASLNGDADLKSMLLKCTLHDAQIYVEPGNDCVRIRGKWSNGIEFGITKEMFEIYDRIAGHVKSL